MIEYNAECPECKSNRAEIETKDLNGDLTITTISCACGFGDSNVN